MKRLIASMYLGVLIFLMSGRIALADEYNVGMIVDGQSVTVTVVVDNGVVTATTGSPVVEIVNAVPVTREVSVAQYIEQMNRTSAAYSVAFSEFWNLANEIVNDADARSVGKLAVYSTRVNNLYSVVKSASDDFVNY